MSRVATPPLPCAPHAASNIMFRAGTGDTVICDMGISRITATRGGVAQDRFVVGTYHYLAPELLPAQHSPPAPTRETDM